MTDRLKGFLQNNIFVLAVFIIAAVLLNAFSFIRDFTSDDYCILKFLITDGHYLVPGFFRPVGDYTLKITGWLFGLRPFYFFLTNAVLHGINTGMLFIFCRKVYPGRGKSLSFAWMSAVIFLCYHSNSEVVLWTIGRGISLAVFFSLLAMLAMASRLQEALKYTLVCSFYFIALSCYESVLLLPLIILLVARVNQKDIHIRIWIILMSITAGFNFLLRYIFTGSLWGGYSGKIFSKNLSAYLIDFAKISARLFIPPFYEPEIFVKVGMMATVLLISVYYLSRKKFKNDTDFLRILQMAVGGIIFSISIAMFFGVSTRTTEGDRLLYFPAVFYSMLLSFIILHFISSIKIIAAVFILLIFYQISFNIIHQQNWIRASEYASKFINEISSRPQRPLYIVNVPSDYKGAYIFRNCLSEALEQHGVNSQGIVIVDHMEYNNDSLIVPSRDGYNIFIRPQTIVSIVNDSKAVISVGRNKGFQINDPCNSILYWNSEKLMNVKCSFFQRQEVPAKKEME